MALAADEDRILISADTDFGELVAVAETIAPSVILFRCSDKRSANLAGLILANTEPLAAEPAAGALIVINDSRICIRRLPIRLSREE